MKNIGLNKKHTRKSRSKRSVCCGVGGFELSIMKCPANQFKDFEFYSRNNGKTVRFQVRK